MLCKIDNHLIQDARRILILLCFAARPLTVPELIDGIAVDIEAPKGLNHKRRLQDSDDIRSICSGFVEIGLDTDLNNEVYYVEDSTPTVRIAHFSVQEYLESESIRHHRAAMFSVNSGLAHAEIAQICLVYLLEGDLANSVPSDIFVEKFPLAHFAATYWYRHYRDVVDPSPAVNSLILELFQRWHSFMTWVKLHDMDRPLVTSIDFNRRLDTIAAPIYYASMLGLDHVLLELIGNSEAGNMTADVNTRGGQFGTALQAASYGGHEKVVQILLEKGADINVQGGQFGNVLQAASYKGHENMIQVLLKNGANVHAQGGRYYNALQTTSYRGHEKIVQRLLEEGIDVNAQGGYFGNALQAASYGGHDRIVQTLLKKGADINARGGRYGNALQAASYRGNEKVVQILLKEGSNINDQGGYFGDALQGASYDGHENVVQILLNAGAEVNTYGGEYGNALQVASSEGHEKVVQMLLENGADVNIQGGRYGNALHAALSEDNKKVICILLDKGAKQAKI